MTITVDNGRWRSVRTPDERKESARERVAALNPREKLMLHKVLAEWQATGRSKIVQEVSAIEWEEQPIPVREWLLREDLIGETGKDMYPQLREDLVELFEGDYHEAILCLHPETRVPLLDGTTPTIAELAARWIEKPEPSWVYSIVGGEIRPAQAVQPRQTGIDDYYRVTLDDGSTFTGNARHQMIMRDGTKRMISDMALGDSITPFDVELLSSKGCGDRLALIGNHFVVGIEKVGRGPVYCLSVPTAGNFAISTSNADGKEVNPIRRSGVFSSNTGAIGWG